MILNARNNGFAFFFPPKFFAPQITKKYEKYYRSLILPYDTIEDFMSSTIQQIELPGWQMDPVHQTRTLGKRQEYKNSKPVADLFKREFTITFKMADAFVNYWLFLENSLNYLDTITSEIDHFEPMRLSFLSNEGYMVTSALFRKPILKGQEGIKMSYSSVTPEFRTFSATFSYFKLDVEVDFGS
jgi:hypothetical protein